MILQSYSMYEQVKKIGKRVIARDPIKIFSDQFHYGHLEIILDSIEVSRGSYLQGILQHGLMKEVTSDYYKNRREFISPFKEAPFFAWNIKNSLEWIDKGGESLIVGAPWAHLISMLGPPNPSKNTSIFPRVLYFPTHTYPGWSHPINLPMRLLEPYRGKITTCLYWSDFLDSQVMRNFAKISESVVTAGYRGSGVCELPWQNLGGRMKFLYVIWELLAHADLVVCDEISSTFFYAASIGKPVMVARDAISYGVIGESGGKYRSYSVEESATQASKSFGLSEFQVGKVLNKEGELVQLSKELLGFDYVSSAKEVLKKFIKEDARLR